jgi:hypothetical protein
MTGRRHARGTGVVRPMPSLCRLIVLVDDAESAGLST